MKKQSGNGFYDLGITPKLLSGIKQLKFNDPTPIQKKSIPLGIQGNDIIAIAQTGSGKTLAFGIPMLQRLAELNNGSGLILVPTRELALQVNESLLVLSRSNSIRTVVIIGGVSINLQMKALKRKPRIIIATPGRLLDHIERKTVSLARTEVFVLDEADRMLDMGFIPDIKKIMKSIPDKSQTMLFSATMPKEIEAIAEKLMEDPTRIEIDRSGASPSEISHEMFYINNQDKKRLLAVKLKQCNGPVLVFTRTKRMASKLAMKVNTMGFSAAEIHSDRSQAQRQRALEGFKEGKFQVLIATDIAARGIDVTGIELVVNYDMPANSEDYVHRIGRTGRAGNIGHAISFATNAQKKSITSIERFMKTKLAISAIPNLPSEKILIKEARKFNFKAESSPDLKPIKRKSSIERPAKRKEAGKFKFKDEASRTERSSKQKISKDRPAKRKESGKFNSKDESSRTERSSKRKFSKDRPARHQEAGKFKSKDEATRTERSSKRKFSKNRPVRNRETGEVSFKDETSRDKKPSKRKFSKTHSSKRHGFKKNDPDKSALKDIESMQKDSKRKKSNKQKTTQEAAKPQKSKKADSKKKEFDKTHSFWSNFKNNRPSRKKTSSQGSKRKKRSKR